MNQLEDFLDLLAFYEKQEKNWQEISPTLNDCVGTSEEKSLWLIEFNLTLMGIENLDKNWNFPVTQPHPHTRTLISEEKL